MTRENGPLPPGVTVAIELVDPDKAAAWLATNKKNRKLKRRAIAQYATDMEKGRWRLNGESFKFAIDPDTGEEFLMDGQNRAMAILQTGATIESVIVRGLDYERDMPNVDSGMGRTMSDVLMLEGELHYSTLAAVLNSYWRQEKRIVNASSVGGSHQELLALLSARPEFRDVAALASSVRAKFPVTPTAFGAAIAFGIDVDEEATYEFARQVESGEGLTRRQPAFVFRNWVTNARATATRKPTPVVWSAVTNKALIAHLEGRELGVLKWTFAQDFPYVQDAQVVTSG
jgi:hypothetical protein